MSSSRPEAISPANVSISCGASASSVSMATMLCTRVLARSARVSMPVPGPISSTRADSGRFAAATIRSAVRRCIKKFCPSDFFGTSAMPLLCLYYHFRTECPCINKTGKLRIDVADELRRLGHEVRSVDATNARKRQEELFFCPRDRHIKQATLFFLIALLVTPHSLVREQSFLKAGNKHGIELESFCRMHGHERNGRFFFFRSPPSPLCGTIHLVLIAGKSRICKECRDTFESGQFIVPARQRRKFLHIL